jgi:hypothetical protein
VRLERDKLEFRRTLFGVLIGAGGALTLAAAAMTGMACARWSALRAAFAEYRRGDADRIEGDLSFGHRAAGRRSERIAGAQRTHHRHRAAAGGGPRACAEDPRGGAAQRDRRAGAGCGRRCATRWGGSRRS